MLASQPHVLLDVTRLMAASIRLVPTGIDRVEFDYARALIAGRSGYKIDFVGTSPVGSTLLGPEAATTLCNYLQSLWTAQDGEVSDDVGRQLVALLESGDRPAAIGCQRVRGPVIPARFVPGFLAFAPHILPGALRLKSLLKAGVERLFYINASHMRAEFAESFSWARASRSIFFLHDLIPVQHPEFCAPAARARHERRLANISRLARYVIVNSEATRRAAESYWQTHGLRVPECVVVPLGISDQFTTARRQKIRAATPYFVCVGTIEPRKNHLFLFNVWRHLVSELGDAAPTLVIVGRRGWENENILDVLDRSVELSKHVIEVDGLSDSGLADVIANSSGLLAPSLAEGFGLPVAEALVLGAPVIASKIPAHVEISQGQAVLLQPHDGAAWAAAIRCGAEGRTPGVGTQARRFRYLTREQHVDKALRLLAA